VICFTRPDFFTVFDIQAHEAMHSIFLECALFPVTKRVLHAKTWMEHCILAEVGVCYRSVGEVQNCEGTGKPPVIKRKK